jgi:hypothetical protein
MTPGHISPSALGAGTARMPRQAGCQDRVRAGEGTEGREQAGPDPLRAHIGPEELVDRQLLHGGSWCMAGRGMQLSGGGWTTCRGRSAGESRQERTRTWYERAMMADRRSWRT